MKSTLELLKEGYVQHGAHGAVGMKPYSEAPNFVRYSPETDSSPATGVFTRVDGEDVELTGDRAKATFDARWRAEHPYETLQNEYTGDRVEEGIPYRLGKWVQEAADPNTRTTMVGSLLDKGPVPAGIGMALGGGALGLGAGWLKDKLFDGSGSASKWGIRGALGLGILGALAGYTRNKEASQYRDPRNFILEKLQMAADVSMAQKAQLAGAVRNLDPVSAQRIADAVHAALGFSVGALLTKLLFGTGTRGTLVGGALGVLGVSLVKNLFSSTPRPVVAAPKMPVYF